MIASRVTPMIPSQITPMISSRVTPMIKQFVHVLVTYLQCKHTALKNQRNNRDVFIVRIMYLIEATCLP